MTQALVREIPSARGRVVAVLEGGYNLDSIAQSFAACASKMVDHAAASATASAAHAERDTARGAEHEGHREGYREMDTAAQREGHRMKFSSDDRPTTVAQPALSKGYQKTVNDVRRLHARYWKVRACVHARRVTLALALTLALTLTLTLRA